MTLEDALRSSPDESPSPFLARRVMRSIREPPPIAFPWRRLTLAIVASGIGIATIAAFGPSADGASVVTFVVLGVMATGTARVVHG